MCGNNEELNDGTPHKVNQKLIDMLTPFAETTNDQKFVVKSLMKSQSWCSPTYATAINQKKGMLQDTKLFMYERSDFNSSKVNERLRSYSPASYQSLFSCLFKSYNSAVLLTLIIYGIRKAIVVAQREDFGEFQRFQMFVHLDFMDYEEFNETSKDMLGTYDSIVLIEHCQINIPAILTKRASDMPLRKVIISSQNKADSDVPMPDGCIFIRQKNPYCLVFTDSTSFETDLKKLSNLTGFNITYLDYLDMINEIDLIRLERLPKREELHFDALDLKCLYQKLYARLKDLADSSVLTGRELLDKYIKLVIAEINDNFVAITSSYDPIIICEVISEFRTLLNHFILAVSELNILEDLSTGIDYRLEYNVNQYIKEFIFKSTAEMETLTFSSGMAALTTILTSINLSVNQIAVYSGEYYEVKELIKAIFSEENIVWFSSNQEFYERMRQYDIDALFVNSFFSDFSVSAKLPLIDFEELLNSAESFPSLQYFIIDITSIDLSNKYNLNFYDHKEYYLYQSMQKFFQLGLDISPGGSVSVVNQCGYDKLKRARAFLDSNMSAYSQLAYDFFLSFPNEINFRHDQIIKISEKIFRKLKEWLNVLDQSMIQITYSKGTPMFYIIIDGDGIEFITCLEKIMKDHGILLYIRSSFGFDDISASLLNPLTADEVIRIAPGIHAQQKINGIVESIKQCIYYYSDNIKYFQRVKKIKIQTMR